MNWIVEVLPALVMQRRGNTSPTIRIASPQIRECYCRAGTAYTVYDQWTETPISDTRRKTITNLERWKDYADRYHSVSIRIRAWTRKHRSGSITKIEDVVSFKGTKYSGELQKTWPSWSSSFTNEFGRIEFSQDLLKFDLTASPLSIRFPDI